jgi:two-component sensor histidine kinase
VEDSGKGLPEGFDPISSDTLGLRLIGALAKQLKGEMNIEQDQAGRETWVTLDF